MSMQVVNDLLGVPPLIRVLREQKPILNLWPYGQYVWQLPSSGPILLNFRLCWNYPRLVQYTHTGVVKGLLGETPLLWVLRGLNGENFFHIVINFPVFVTPGLEF